MRFEDQLAAETRSFFHRRQRQPHIVRGYFGGPHVRYTFEFPINSSLFIDENEHLRCTLRRFLDLRTR
ncbi:hypothetical protein [Streptomyces sp. NPDC052811]|uniref:hypothetical protein n=1 Tax=Streptomyces sp. NPDC052811 TaxID=3155731 RepID=UPI00342B8FE2